MRFTTKLLGIFCSILIISSIILSAQEGKIRIIKKDAVLRLKPNEKSLIIKHLPLGSEFNIVEVIGKWIKINLPPDKDGIVIAGYIHRSFIEFLKGQTIKKPNKNIVIKPDKKFELPVKKVDDGYSQWKKDLARAKGRKSTGSILSILGGVIFVPCFVLTFAHQETIYEYGYWGLVQYEKKKARWPYIVGDALGLTSLIVGLTIYLPARGSVKKLEEEGREKGYFKVGFLPEYKGVGIKFIFSF